MHIVVDSKEKCCGCAACVNSCPVDAINMTEDDYGFTYPLVDEAKCLDCGKCLKYCVFTQRNYGENHYSQVLIGKSNNDSILIDSSSGGIFSSLALAVLDTKGIVYGAAWNNYGGVEHIGIRNRSDLYLLQGSKYVQSNINNIFREVKDNLDSGINVLFVGTPCQVSGLKSFVGTKYINLLTIDIVCHGVPNQKMLADDIKYMSNKYDLKPKVVKFRDKKYGWGTNGSISDGIRTIKYSAINSPYYYSFLNALFYRPSCYNCRFPAEGRQGDITIGDYWGVDLLDEKVLGDSHKGISCIIINTEKGEEWFSKAMNSLDFCSSSFDKISLKNGQLKSCSKRPEIYDELLNDYKTNGYSAIVRHFNKKWYKRFVLAIKAIVPRKIKRVIALKR